MTFHVLELLFLAIFSPFLFASDTNASINRHGLNSKETSAAATPPVSLSFPTTPSISNPSRAPLLMLSTMDGTVSAFDAQTGDVVFTYHDSRPAVHSWAAPGQPEYVPSLDGLLYRIDRETDEAHVVEGKFISRDHASSLADALPSSPRGGSDAVVLTNEDSSLLFIDMRAGRVIRETRFADATPPDPPLTTRSDVIVVIQRTAVAVRIIDTSTGRELANATLVHTEPRFWQHGRCLTAPSPALDQFVAYTTEARDRVVVRNLHSGAIIWTKDVAAPVVEVHGLGGVRIAGSHRDAMAISGVRRELPDHMAAPPVPVQNQRPIRDVVVADDGRYVYATIAPTSQKSTDSDASLNVPVPSRLNLRRYTVANTRDPSSLGSADRVLGVSRVPRRKYDSDISQNADDFALQLTSIEAGISFMIIVMVGVVGYVMGRRPRRSKKKPTSAPKRRRHVPGDGAIEILPESSEVRKIDSDEESDSDLDTDDRFATVLRRGQKMLPGVTHPALSRDDHGLVSSNSSTGSGNGGFISNRSQSGWLTVGCLRVSSKVIGVGSHGTVVYEGKLMPGERKVAVKRLLRQFYESARKEISLLVELDEASPHVVRYFAMEEDSEFIYLALELCASSLAECIAERTPPVPSSVYQHGPPPSYTSRALRQLMQGLADLHRVGVVHRDVKPQNVLLTRSANSVGDIKLADVGLALRLGENRSSYTAVTNAGGGIGTTGWRAPEILSGGRQTKAVDIFAAGCVVSSILTGGNHPFGNAIFGRDGNIAAGTPTLTALESLELPEASDVIRKMIDPIASDRPTAEEVLRHPFFWTDATKLSFLVDISDRLYDLRHHPIRYTDNLDRYPMARKYCSDWLVLMDMDLLSSLGRGYENTASGLLRVIRNKRNHYSELALSIRTRLGPLPEDRPDTSMDNDSNSLNEDDGNFLTYFTKRVPNLLMCIYRYALENPALTDQPHFTRYGLKSMGESEQAFIRKREFLRDHVSQSRSGNDEGKGSSGEIIGNELDLLEGGRKAYHRHELVAIQANCEGIEFEVRRRLVMADVYQPSAYKRYKKRLVTNYFSDSDFDDEDRAFPSAEAGGPRGFTRVIPRKGQSSSVFGSRIQNSLTSNAETFGSRVSNTYGNGTSHLGTTPPRRNGTTSIAPTISQFSGEERVVDFGSLRRRN